MFAQPVASAMPCLSPGSPMRRPPGRGGISHAIETTPRAETPHAPPTPLLLLLLLPAPAAHAVPSPAPCSHGGRRARPGTDATSRPFAVGEAVLLRFAYDAETRPYHVEFHLAPRRVRPGPAHAALRRGPRRLRRRRRRDLLRQSEDSRTITLKLWGDAGEVAYSRGVDGVHAEGFLADVARVTVGGAVRPPSRRRWPWAWPGRRSRAWDGGGVADPRPEARGRRAGRIVTACGRPTGSFSRNPTKRGADAGKPHLVSLKWPLFDAAATPFWRGVFPNIRQKGGRRKIPPHRHRNPSGDVRRKSSESGPKVDQRGGVFSIRDQREAARQVTPGSRPNLCLGLSEMPFSPGQRGHLGVRPSICDFRCPAQDYGRSRIEDP
jgi:hypothetical protein